MGLLFRVGMSCRPVFPGWMVWVEIPLNLFIVIIGGHGEGLHKMVFLDNFCG